MRVAGRSAMPTNANTSRVRRWAPSTRWRRSNISFTMFRPTRKTRMTSRMMLRLMSDQHRIGAERAGPGRLGQAGLEDGEGHHRERGGEDDPALASTTPRLG